MFDPFGLRRSRRSSGISETTSVLRLESARMAVAMGVAVMISVDRERQFRLLWVQGESRHQIARKMQHVPHRYAGISRDGWQLPTDIALVRTSFLVAQAQKRERAVRG